MFSMSFHNLQYHAFIAGLYYVCFCVLLDSRFIFNIHSFLFFNFFNPMNQYLTMYF